MTCPRNALKADVVHVSAGNTRDLLDRNSRHRTIAEIAFTAGFRDISHFNRLFKRCNGLAPREFRRTAGGR